MAEPELPLRARVACAVSNLTRKALHLLGRGGTNLPGALALRLCPDLPALLARGVRVLAVSGTNGKTTTCRMIAAAAGKSKAEAIISVMRHRRHQLLTTDQGAAEQILRILNT